MFWKLTIRKFNCIPFTWISNFDIQVASNISEKSAIKPHPTTVDMEIWMFILLHLCETSRFLFSV